MATKRKEPESQRISWFLYLFELPLLCMSAKRYSIAGRISAAKRFYFLNFYPALQEYVHRLFAYGALSFDLDDTSREEPDYLDRTWLMHGRCCREVTRMDCVQLLNALDVCEYIFNKPEDGIE
ncbi:hypothetical protein IMM1_27230 [Pseudocoprococcus immobilis]